MSEFSIVSKQDLLLAIKTIIDDKSKVSNQIVNTTPKFISRKETSNILGISLPTLNVWTKNGIIDSYKAGSSVRYKEGDVFSCFKKVDVIKYRS